MLERACCSCSGLEFSSQLLHWAELTTAYNSSPEDSAGFHEQPHTERETSTLINKNKTLYNKINVDEGK